MEKAATGKGDMATDMKDVTDFTKPDALKNRTDGELSTSSAPARARCPPKATAPRMTTSGIW